VGSFDSSPRILKEPVSRIKRRPSVTGSPIQRAARERMNCFVREKGNAALERLQIVNDALCRAVTCSGDSPSGHPSLNRLHPGRCARIAAVVEPS